MAAREDEEGRRHSPNQLAWHWLGSLNLKGGMDVGPPILSIYLALSKPAVTLIAVCHSKQFYPITYITHWILDCPLSILVCVYLPCAV